MFALGVYKFFQKKKALLFTLVLSLFLLFGFYASKIKVEEDLTRFIPEDEKLEEINFILNNLKIKDKLAINLYFSDSTLSDEMVLTAMVDSLNEEFQQEKYVPYFKSVIAKTEDDKFMQMHEQFYQNLPVLLDDEDYVQIENMLSKDSIQKTLESNYKTLLSPSGAVFSKFISKDPLNITPIVLKKLQTLQFDENFDVSSGYVLTKDRKNALIIITPAIAPNESASNEIMLAMINSSIAKVKSQFSESVEVEYYGAAPVSLGNSKQIKKDALYTSLTAVFLILLILFLFFKDILVLAYILLPVAFGACFSIAMLYLVKTEVSAIALGAGSIIFGIAINYSLHFFTHFKHEQSAEQVVKDLSLPMLIGCITTVGAFLSLQFAKSEALHDFGFFAGCSLIGSVLFSIIVLPHLLRGKKTELDKPIATPNFLEKAIGYRLDKNKPVVIVALLLTIVFAYTSQKVEFDSDLMKINYQSEKLTKAQQNLDEINKFSLRSLYVVSRGNSLDEALRKNENSAQQIAQLKEQNVVAKYSSLAGLIPSDSLKNVRIQKWNSFWTKERRDTLKQRLVNEGLTFKFKPTAFSSFIHLIDSSSSNVNDYQTAEFIALFGEEFITKVGDEYTVTSMLKVDADTRQQVYDAFEKVKGVLVFDKQYLSSLFVEVISSDFNLILIITALLVFGFMLLSHGRIELAFINFLPMFISWLWILGLMGIFGLKFNIINIIISTFIFGLGDDYSIFILDGLSHEYKYGKKNLDSYKTSILLSVLTTIIGIGVLIFAEHPALRSIASITIIGMCVVVFISFIVQPLLYNFIILNRRRRQLLPYTFLNLTITFAGFLVFTIGSFLLTIFGFVLFYLTPIPKSKKKFIFHYSIMVICKFMLSLFVNVKKNVINLQNENFKKPSIIISNHQSHIDLALTLMLHPKMIVFTNDWVWNSPFYGRIVRMADFYPASQGYENAIEKVKQLMNEGYSVLIFPEGTRSINGDILRFHKGAFYLAETLKSDIIPILIHGAGDCVTKGDFHFKEGTLTVKILPRIAYNDSSFGVSYQDRSKGICKHMRKEYALLKQEVETVHYFRPKLIKNYIFKGPVLEWYCRVKTKLEDDYSFFDNTLPKSGKITDVGCGYGFLSLMLQFTSNSRTVQGIDYDEEKIEIAKNCISKSERVDFVCADITKHSFEKSDAFVINDVLHYLLKDQQIQVIQECVKNLNPGGLMIIRDADADKKKRHWGTRYTEFFSTNSGFNKTQNELHFVSSNLIKEALQKFDHLTYEIIDNTKLTSNIVFVVRHK